MFSDYTPPAPTPRELRLRLASAKKQLLKLRALRQRACQVAIDIVKGLGLRVRCARRPPSFLYDVFRCSPIWEADDRCKLTFIYPAPPRQWQAELKRLRTLLDANGWPHLLQSIPLRAVYSSKEWGALQELQRPIASTFSLPPDLWSPEYDAVPGDNVELHPGRSVGGGCSSEAALEVDADEEHAEVQEGQARDNEERAEETEASQGKSA